MRIRTRTAALLTALSAVAALPLAATAVEPAAQPYAWSNAPLLGGGFVDGFEFHPTERGLLYARTDVGGAYRWDARAGRWIPLNDDLGRGDDQLAGALSLALDPHDPKRVYIAAGEYLGPYARTATILRSDDQGASWSRTELPFHLGGNQDGRSTGERLQVDPHDGAVLLLGTTRDGLWRSDDHGVTWRRVAGFPAASLTLVQFDPQSGRDGQPTPVIYAGAADLSGPSLYISRDAGSTWAPVPGTPKGMMPHHVALDGRGTLYATFGNGPGPSGVTDGCVWALETASGLWRDITPVKPEPGQGVPFGYAGLSLDRQHPGALVVSTLDRWRPGDDLFQSLDGGAHWTSVGARSHHDLAEVPWVEAYAHGKEQMGHWMGALEIDPFDPAHVLYGTGYGVWETHDLSAPGTSTSVQWRFADQGFEETVPLELASPPQGAHLLVAIGDIGGFRWDRFDVSDAHGYFDPPTETNRSVDFAELKPSLVVRTADQAKSSGYVSNDGGATWAPIPSSPRQTHTADGRYAEAGRIAVSAKGGFWVWAPQRQPGFVSTDQGRTWTASQGWPETQGRQGQLAPVADRAVDGVFYLYDATLGDLRISVDGGKSFKPIAQGLPQGGGLMRAVPGRARDLWLPTPQGLIHSPDPSKPFANVKSVQEAWAVGFGKAAPGRAYPAVFLWGKVGGAAGLFRSDDEGASWIRIDDPTHRFGAFSAIAGDPRVWGRIYLATGGRGVIVGDIR
jgi:photosystem II stability/assembly factor-like uncharacterized protein